MCPVLRPLSLLGRFTWRDTSENFELASRAARESASAAAAEATSAVEAWRLADFGGVFAGGTIATD